MLILENSMQPNTKARNIGNTSAISTEVVPSLWSKRRRIDGERFIEILSGIWRDLNKIKDVCVISEEIPMPSVSCLRSIQV